MKNNQWRKRNTLEVFVNLDQSFTPLEIFNTVTGMNELLAIIVTESNRYATIKKL